MSKQRRTAPGERRVTNVTALRYYGNVEVIRPSFDLSRILVRADDPGATLADLAGRTAVINAPLSNTGAHLLRAAVAEIAAAERFFAATRITGSHRASVAAVAEGLADVAAIDAVTHAVLTRDKPQALTGLRQVATTPRAPNLPFVTARTTPQSVVVALRDALHGATRDPALAFARDKLFLSDIEPASVHRYVALRAIGRHRPQSRA